MERVDSAINDVRAQMSDANRVAIGNRMGGTADADGPVRARNALDDNGLFERFAHSFGQQTRNRVSRPAGGECHDDRDWPGGISSRPRDPGQGRQCGNACREVQKLAALKVVVPAPVAWGDAQCGSLEIGPGYTLNCDNAAEAC